MAKLNMDRYQYDPKDEHQVFLSALKYHRWHSPVKGSIRKAYVKQTDNRCYLFASVWAMRLLVSTMKRLTLSSRPTFAYSRVIFSNRLRAARYFFILK